MHPLIGMWLFVVGSMVLLMGVFWAVEYIPEIIGNFYVLLGIFAGGYALYWCIGWAWKKRR